MDFIQAYRMVLSTLQSVKDMSRDFSAVVAAADSFVLSTNERLKKVDSEYIVENCLREVRVGKKNKMSGEDAGDDVPEDPLERFEIETYNMIMGRASQSLENRFNKHQELHADIRFSCFDTNNFFVISLLAN